MPKILTLAKLTTANASFNSQKSTSFTLILARSKAIGTALDGAVVNHSLLCAASANDLILAIGFNPSSAAFSALINTKAEAPSLMVDALAAVTVPSFLNTALNVGIFSNLTLVYSSSLLKRIGSPLR